MKTKEAIETKLLPCPFCGCEDVGSALRPHPLKPREYFGISCECGATSGFRKNESDAAEAWNTRASDLRSPWVRIESVDDLPKESGSYFAKIDPEYSSAVATVEQFSAELQRFHNTHVIAYMPIPVYTEAPDQTTTKVTESGK